MGKFQSVLAVFFLIGVAPLYAKELIKVAKEERQLYARDHYIIELLQTALANDNYQLEHIPVHPHQQRTLLKLSQGEVDIHWSMTSPEREEIAIAIPVPIFKGLIGTRIALIKQGEQARFDGMTLSELKQLAAVQGHDWPDTKILVQNGFRVKPSANYPVMFSMLARGLVSYFPRSVIEIHDELSQFSSLNLAIEQQQLIVYPTAFYFFVNKDKSELANHLAAGLNAMIEDGRFDRLFDQYFASALSELRLATRKVHQLENNYLPATVPFSNNKLWYSIEQKK